MNKWIYFAQRLLVATMIIITLHSGNIAYAADPYIYLYNEGFKSYKKDNYVRAYSYLFAYYEIARIHGTQSASTLKHILDAVHYCEGELYNAVVTKKELDQYGNVISITVDASGKYEGPARKVTYPFRNTTRHTRQKVYLPPSLN